MAPAAGTALAADPFARTVDARPSSLLDWAAAANGEAAGPLRALASTDPPALPGDALWEAMPVPLLTGYSASPRAVMPWGGQLCVGGFFTHAGTTNACYVATWDGAHWQPLGNPAYGIDAMQVWSGSLYASTDAGSGRPGLLRWNGASWDSVTTVSSPYGIDLLGTYQGDLVVAGNFLMLNGDTVRHIARFDGAQWHAMGTGLLSPVGQSSSSGFDMQEFAGKLYITGNNANSVRCWDGATWTTPSAGVLTGATYAFAADATYLYALGFYTVPFPGGGTTSAAQVWRYDGTTWTQLGANNTADGFSLALYDGSLYARKSSTAGQVVRWNGANWVSVGDSLGTSLFRLEVVGSDLIALGSFIKVGSRLASGVARFDGATWSPVIEAWTPDMRGASTWTTDAVVRNDTLIVVGNFRNAADGDHFVAGSGAFGFDGVHWNSLGTFSNLGANGLTLNVALVGTDAVIGNAGFSGSPFIARWNGTALAGYPPGFDWSVWDAIEYQGSTYACGDFDAPFRVARWTGVAWTDVGSGLDIDGGGRAFAVHGGRLVVAGGFATAGGTPAANIAAWDGGTWSALGAGLSAPLNPRCNALAVWNGDLVAGGNFTTAGGVAATGVARWDGSQWHAMGDNAIRVEDFAQLDGDLYAAGSFWHGGQSVSTIARWTGTTWRLLGSGSVWGSFLWVEPYQGALYAGGSFTRAFGKTTAYIVRLPNAAVAGVDPVPAPFAGLRLAASPNPGSGRARLSWVMPSRGRARVTILDVTGRLVATLADGMMEPGQQSVEWRSEAPAGVYFATLEAAGERVTTRVVRLD